MRATRKSTFTLGTISIRKQCVKTPKDPDLPYAALEMSACAAFIKESRLKCAEVTSCTGDPGEGRHVGRRIMTLCTSELEEACPQPAIRPSSPLALPSSALRYRRAAPPFPGTSGPGCWRSPRPPSGAPGTSPGIGPLAAILSGP